MSMLAEPRRKQKWTLNPRGKQWSEDSNKFGQKMLEKMGWSSGKGLGAQEQGMTDHVRVAFKNDSAGVGFKKDNMDKAWTEHQDSFNDFLQELHKSQEGNVAPVVENVSESLSGKSLELKSKQSRARVHYKKFTRGKDVNKYSTKDLANIFGQKDLSTNSSSKEEPEDLESTETVGTEDKRGGVVTINSGNMADYFMKKGHNLYNNYEKNKVSRTRDSESETEYVGFGFASSQNQAKSENETACNYAFVNPCLKINSPEQISSPSTPIKFSKKRKIENTTDNDSSGSNGYSKKLKGDHDLGDGCENGFVNAGLNLDSQNDDGYNGKEFEVSRAQFGLANCALDLTDESNDKKRVRFNDHVEYSTDPIKKKKGKATLDKFEVENKKHKKKRKQNEGANNSESGFVNEGLDFEEVSVEMNDNELNERKSRKAKKRKDRSSNLETIVETPEEDKEVGDEKTEATDTPLAEDLENPGESATKKKTKKKKKDKKEKVKEENAVFTDNNGDTEVAQVVKETKIKRRSVDGGEFSFARGNDEESTKEEKIKDVEVEISPEKIDGQIQDKCTKKSKKKKKKAKNDSSDNEGKDEKIKRGNKEAEDLEDVGSGKETAKSGKKNDSSNSNDIETVQREEKEVSDKENTNNEEPEGGSGKKPKKNKKHRKSIDKSTLEHDNSNCNAENHVQEVPSVHTPSKRNPEHVEGSRGTRSPWNEKARMSKKLLKSLFLRNSTLQFPGSNIHEIKGYGADVQ